MFMSVIVWLFGTHRVGGQGIYGDFLVCLAAPVAFSLPMGHHWRVVLCSSEVYLPLYVTVILGNTALGLLCTPCLSRYNCPADL